MPQLHKHFNVVRYFKHLPILHYLRKLPLYFFLTIFSSCQWTQPTAYFFISNESEDKKAVDIKVTIAGRSVFNDTITYTDVRPDLQFTPYVRVPKGKYIIRVSADNGAAKTEQKMDLGSDRWIFVSYFYSNPVDSVVANSLLENFRDTSFINPKIRGTPSKLTIWIMDKEPVHM